MQFGTLSNRQIATFGPAAQAGLATPTNRRHITKAGVSLWVVQGLIAAMFVFAGASKLVLPAEDLTRDSDLSVEFMRFIGVVELLGGVGVVLPALLRILPALTPLAAAGLVIVMIGATTITAASVGIAPALFPLFVGVLAGTIVYGRTRLAPISGR